MPSDARWLSDDAASLRCRHEPRPTDVPQLDWPRAFNAASTSASCHSGLRTFAWSTVACCSPRSIFARRADAPWRPRWWRPRAGSLHCLDDLVLHAGRVHLRNRKLASETTDSQVASHVPLRFRLSPRQQCATRLAIHVDGCAFRAQQLAISAGRRRGIQLRGHVRSSGPALRLKPREYERARAPAPAP
jgi:hypothetical protein